jgi:hypothetical protein
MRSECVAKVSRSNFDSAIEAFLRSVDIIHDSETPHHMRYTFSKTDDTVSIGIFFKEDQKPTDQVVH